MAETQHLSQTLSQLFIDTDNGWFTTITSAVQGLSAEQAAAAPAKGFNSVWAVLNHVWIIQKKILRKLRREAADPAENTVAYDWPAIADPLDEIAWQTACARALAVNQELTQFIAALPAQSLTLPLENDPGEVWQLIHGLIGHNSYHACEIITIRNMQGFWLESV